MKNPTFLIVIAVIVGMSSIASAVPIITGPSVVQAGNTYTYSLNGTHPYVFEGYVWVDYPSYMGMLSSISYDPGCITDIYCPYYDCSDGFAFCTTSPPCWGEWLTFDLTIPSGATGGTVYSIDLLSSALGILSEFPVTVQFPLIYDLGDALNPYGTLFASNGAHHIAEGPWLGDANDMPDIDQDGQPDAGAAGDDNDGNDDENGVIIPVLSQGVPKIINIEVSGGGGNVNFWIDWNGDQDWADPCELIYSGWMDDGTNPVVVRAPLSSIVGQTFSRCRISSQGGLGPKGPADDGEVEDHIVNIEIVPLDFGDAPDSYSTLLESNGARHIIDDVTYMGNSVDAEPNGLPHALALGDDNDNIDDEDGVIMTIQITASVDGYLNAWFDFNVDGRFSNIYEHAVVDLPLAAGPNSISYDIPLWAAIDIMSYCRYRFTSYDPNGSLSYDGLAQDGEVEDYRFYVFTSLPCFSPGHPDYDMWVSVGKPFCWCCEYQCKGDADCDFGGKDKDGSRKWVTAEDNNILSECWQKVDDEYLPPYCICADFDHNFGGKDKDGARKWVTAEDNNILAAGWQKVDTDPHFTTNPCFP